MNRFLYLGIVGIFTVQIFHAAETPGATNAHGLSENLPSLGRSPSISELPIDAVFLLRSSKKEREEESLPSLGRSPSAPESSPVLEPMLPRFTDEELDEEWAEAFKRGIPQFESKSYAGKLLNRCECRPTKPTEKCSSLCAERKKRAPMHVPPSKITMPEQIAHLVKKAVETGDIKTLNNLRADGVNFSMIRIGADGQTPCLYAVSRQNLSVIECLKDGIHDISDAGISAAGYAAMLRDSRTLTYLMAIYKISLQSQPDTDPLRSPLILAAAQGCSNSVGCLLVKGASLSEPLIKMDHATLSQGEAALSLAISRQKGQSMGVVEKLLASRVNPDVGAFNNPKEKEVTPLMHAAREGFVSLVDLLVQYNANVGARSSAGRTPLMLAAIGGHQEVVKNLVEKHGAQIDVPQKEGSSCTALTLAAERGNLEVVQYLWNVRAKNHENERCNGVCEDVWALQSAVHAGHVPVVEFLLQQGVDVTTIGQMGTSTHELAKIERDAWGTQGVETVTQQRRAKIAKLVKKSFYRW